MSPVPAPWWWRGGSLVLAADGKHVLEGREYEALHDTARLIAAAPELLATVKKLLAQVHADCLREGEEAVVEAAEALVDRIETASP